MQEGFSSATELGRCGEVRNGSAGRRLALSEVRMLNSVPDGWSLVGVGDFNVTPSPTSHGATLRGP